MKILSQKSSNVKYTTQRVWVTFNCILDIQRGNFYIKGFMDIGGEFCGHRDNDIITELKLSKPKR